MEHALVVVPAWNEEAAIAAVVQGVRSQGLPVLVVDDGSGDRTSAVARAAGAVVVRLPVNLGVGAALRAGFRYARQQGYTTVVTVDGDGQHPISAIPSLLAVSDAALVLGSRFLPGSVAPGWVSGTRSFAMRLLRRRIRRRFGVDVHDPTSGFRVVREPLLSVFCERFPVTYLGDTFEAYMMAAGCLPSGQIVEVAVTMEPRTTGEASSRGLRNVAYFCRAVLATSRLVWQAPRSTTNAIDSNRVPLRRAHETRS